MESAKRSAGSEAEPASQRRRLEDTSLAPDEATWSFRIPMAADLRQWTESVGNALSMCQLQAVCAGDFQGLRADGVDATRAAMVTAQLWGQVTLKEARRPCPSPSAPSSS